MCVPYRFYTVTCDVNSFKQMLLSVCQHEKQSETDTVLIKNKIRLSSVCSHRTLGKQNQEAEFRHQLQLWRIFCTLMARLNMNNPFHLYVCIQQCVYGRVCVCYSSSPCSAPSGEMLIKANCQSASQGAGGPDWAIHYLLSHSSGQTINYFNGNTP